MLVWWQDGARIYLKERLHMVSNGKLGFLWDAEEKSFQVTGELAHVGALAELIPDLLPTEHCRSHIQNRLTSKNIEEALRYCSEAQTRVYLLNLTYLTQAYVWGGEKPATSLPVEIAQPLSYLASRFDQKPILIFRNYVLDNWKRLDQNQGVTLDNIMTPLKFFWGDR